MVRQLLKVKLEGEEVKLRYRELTEVSTRTVNETKRDAPDPAFPKSIAALQRPLLKLLELGLDYVVEVTGVRFVHDEEKGRGAMITAKRSLDRANSPLNLASPLWHFPAEGATKDDEALRDALDLVEKHAELYIVGRRAQATLDEAQEVAEDERDAGQDETTEADAPTDTARAHAR